MDFAGRLGAEQRLEGELSMGERAVPLSFVTHGRRRRSRPTASSR
jgi:hypothetical protein